MVLSVTTELIGAEGITTTQINTFLNLLQTQGATDLIVRILAATDFTDGVPNSSSITAFKNIINRAPSYNMNIYLDSHTWYTTWDNYFEDGVSAHETYRDTYLTYITALINAMDGYDVKGWMVLNEPQATTASTEENNFILEVISTAKALTELPVSVRFMAGYSPSTGHYSSAIDSATDFLCRNSYWDPRSPGTSVYGCTQAKLETLYTTGTSLGKEVWITEFGKVNSNQTEQANYVEAWVTYANTKAIAKIFCWVSQPIGGTSETYNIFNGWTPRPAFYKLVNVTAPPRVLTIIAGDGGSTSPVAGDYEYVSGTTSNPITATADGTHSFSHWLVNSSIVRSENPVSILMDANYTLQPVFTPLALDTWTFTVIEGVGGAMDAVSPYYGAGTYTVSTAATVNFRAVPDDSYTWNNWNYWENGVQDTFPAAPTNPDTLSNSTPNVILSIQPVFLADPSTYPTTIKFIRGNLKARILV